MLSDARSPAALQLVGYASAAQRAGGRRERPCPHALVFFLRPEDFLTVGESDPHPLADRIRVFARERENVGQEGFDALVLRVSPPYISLADSPSPSKAPRRAREGRW